jgi:peptidoglycan/LPS O-acetylase OafA/YrhL
MHWTGMSPVLQVVSSTMRAGWTGVDIFFVLSGFLITGILLDARGDGPVRPPGYYRAFYTRRALRIFPVYYAFLAYIFILRKAQVPSGAWWYWTYLTNVMFARVGWTPSIEPHLWSLAVEEQFYLFWPAAISLIRRSWLRPICWALIVLSTGLRIVVAQHWGWTPAYVLTVCRLDEFAAGALLASYARARQPVGNGPALLWVRAARSPRPACWRIRAPRSASRPAASWRRS